MQSASSKKLFEYGQKLGKIIMDGVLSVVAKQDSGQSADLNSTSDEAK